MVGVTFAQYGEGLFPSWDLRHRTTFPSEKLIPYLRSRPWVKAYLITKGENDPSLRMASQGLRQLIMVSCEDPR